MHIVKFIVSILCIRIVTCIGSRYCGICKNHTLCKYFVEGPSSECVNYDKAALLTHKDILEILNRINERRDSVAKGLLKQFPQAANMKKMRWSTRLANFAQRWADQCDSSVKPDKEDDCRDLVNMKVGQNIATVLGPSPGMNVKSFVDTWFMMNLHYRDSVTYFNQSKDTRTNYFTQLIWADTSFVGCGRAKFFIEDINMVVERLICNFAPKGNNYGSPVYTIGYPGTQCPKPMIPDTQFPSLCKQTPIPASSLLRVLNSSNNSLKQELDPNNWTQIRSSNDINDQRNQKARHVYLNNSFGATRGPVHVLNQNPMIDRNYKEPQFAQRHFTQDSSHSQMYHGYMSENPVHTIESHTHAENYFRRSQYTTPAPFYSSSVLNARKHYVGDQCTRKIIKIQSNTCHSTAVPCIKNECTRRFITNNCPQAINQCHSITNPHIDFANTFCLCNDHTTPRAQIKFDCSNNCQPTTSGCHLSASHNCPHRRAGGDEQGKSTNSFNYYDPFHDAQIKSVNDDSYIKQPWHFENLYPKNMRRIDTNKRECNDMTINVKSTIDAFQPKVQNMQDSYRSFYSSKRKERDINDHTFKPFWEMDEYNQKKALQLKSIKYTTLASKKLRKTRTTELTTRLPTSTETITIKGKEKSSSHYNHRGRVTEKYLSFDELMHLRKLSTIEREPIDKDARRRADAQHLRTASSEMTTITANTPFYRMKYCTRKLTCTWTAAFNGTGGPGGGGGGFDVGSRTPPGYVDGCTRTSTCTRDYMDRNKMATSSNESPETTLEDEDYCERRRRNLEENRFEDFSIKLRTVFPTSFTEPSKEIVTKSQNPEVDPYLQIDDCICYKDATRIKREKVNSFKQLLKKNCNRVGNHKETKRQPHINYFARRSSSEPENRISYQCPCNGNISLRNLFCSSLKLKYCLMWLYSYMFIIRIVLG